MSTNDCPTEDVGPKQVTYSSSTCFYLSESRFISNSIIVTVSKSLSLCHGRDGWDVSSAVFVPCLDFSKAKTCVPFFVSLFVEKTSRTHKKKPIFRCI